MTLYHESRFNNAPAIVGDDAKLEHQIAMDSYYVHGSNGDEVIDSMGSAIDQLNEQAVKNDDYLRVMGQVADDEYHSVGTVRYATEIDHVKTRERGMIAYEKGHNYGKDSKRHEIHENRVLQDALDPPAPLQEPPAPKYEALNDNDRERFDKLLKDIFMASDTRAAYGGIDKQKKARDGLDHRTAVEFWEGGIDTEKKVRQRDGSFEMVPVPGAKSRRDELAAELAVMIREKPDFAQLVAAQLTVSAEHTYGTGAAVDAQRKVVEGHTEKVKELREEAAKPNLGKDELGPPIFEQRPEAPGVPHAGASKEVWDDYRKKMAAHKQELVAGYWVAPVAPTSAETPANTDDWKEYRANLQAYDAAQTRRKEELKLYERWTRRLPDKPGFQALRSIGPSRKKRQALGDARAERAGRKSFNTERGNPADGYSHKKWSGERPGNLAEMELRLKGYAIPGLSEVEYLDTEDRLRYDSLRDVLLKAQELARVKPDAALEAHGKPEEFAQKIDEVQNEMFVNVLESGTYDEADERDVFLNLNKIRGYILTVDKGLEQAQEGSDLRKDLLAKRAVALEKYVKARYSREMLRIITADHMPDTPEFNGRHAASFKRDKAIEPEDGAQSNLYADGSFTDNYPGSPSTGRLNPDGSAWTPKPEITPTDVEIKDDIELDKLRENQLEAMKKWFGDMANPQAAHEALQFSQTLAMKLLSESRARDDAEMLREGKASLFWAKFLKIKPDFDSTHGELRMGYDGGVQEEMDYRGNNGVWSTYSDGSMKFWTLDTVKGEWRSIKRYDKYGKQTD